MDNNQDLHEQIAELLTTKQTLSDNIQRLTSELAEVDAQLDQLTSNLDEFSFIIYDWADEI